MKLEPLMTVRVQIKPPVDVGAGPFGTRRIIDLVGGDFEGPRLKGRVLPGGGDWVLFDNEGVARLDVRVNLQTHDEALLYVQYPGILVVNEKVAQAMAVGTPVDFGETYFMTTPRIETGDPRYTWLNRLVTVGEGRIHPGVIEYRISAVHHG